MVSLAWGAAIVLLLQWLLRGMPALPLWHWLLGALLVLSGAGLLALHAWAARRSYVLFTPETGSHAPEPCALAPEDKIALRAAGRFEVEGRTAFLAGLQAYWRSFGTREHVVMAIRHPSRFLLLGRVPLEQVGMWYMFIPAEAVETISAGRLAFGTVAGPALRLVYRRIERGPDARKMPKPVRERVYLMFEEEPMRERVWADLLC